MPGSNLNVLAIVLAGGMGERLRPLTDGRAKPAVPFGGVYRIIDFVVTNLFNSGIYKIVLLTQYNPASLNRHVKEGYMGVFGSARHSYIELRQPANSHYRGTANAVYQNLELIAREEFDIVDVFGADNIYRMNVAQMHDYHISRDAEATISVMPVRIDAAQGQLGVVVVDKEGRITNFEEKPENPTPMPGDASKCLVSMGNYCFNPRFLAKSLETNPNDFGKQVFPRMAAQKNRVFAYNFLQNTIEGFRPEEIVYWRDVGTLRQFYDAHMDLVGENPALRLQHQKWRMLTNIELPEPSRTAGRGLSLDTIVANGVWIHDDAEVRGSVLSYGVEVLHGASIRDSVLMGYTVVGEGSIIKNAVIDRRARIPPGTAIGIDVEDDKKRGFKVEEWENGCRVSVVPRTHEFK